MWRDAMGTCHCVTINFEGWTCPASGSVSPSFTTFSAPGRTERPQQSGFSGRSPTRCLPPFWEPSRYRPRLSVLRDDHWDRRKGCRVADAVIEALSSLSGATRSMAMATFARMYSGTEGGEDVLRYMGQTGLDAHKGADILRSAVDTYASTVTYPAGNPIAASLRGVAQVKLADLGTRVFYTAHGSFDTHASHLPMHAKLWQEIDGAIDAFFQDLRAHHAADDLIMLVWTEFGRRVQENGSGTDHGAGGVAFVIGKHVRGGMYGTYPSLRPERLTQQREGMFGNLRYSYDFRGLYSTIVERWFGLDGPTIVGGQFEPLDFL